MKIANWSLMRHPMNWLTIWLMLFIAGIGLHFVMVGMGRAQPRAAGYGNKVSQSTGRPPGFSQPAATDVAE